MNQRIVIDPTKCHGQPIIRGTRVPVSRVLGYLAGGMSIEDVQRDFELTAEDVRGRPRICGGVDGGRAALSTPGLRACHAIPR